MSATWLVRSGVVLVCPVAESPRWERLGDGWRVRHYAPLVVRASWEEVLPALILPPAVGTAASFGPGREIRCVGLRGALLVCRAIQSATGSRGSSISPRHTCDGNDSGTHEAQRDATRRQYECNLGVRSVG